MFKVISYYEPLKNGELCLNVGDDVDRVKDIGNGWLLGRNVTTGESGIFPEDYISRDTSVSSAITRRFTKKTKPSIPNKGPKVNVLNTKFLQNTSSENSQANGMDEGTVDQGTSNDTIHQLQEGYDKLQKNVRKAAKITMDKVSDMNFKVLKTEESEYRLLKTVWRVIAAIVAGTTMYLMLYFSFGFDVLNAGLLVIALFIFFLIGFVFSKLIRCVILLMLPTLFTGRGRAFFLSIITGLLLAGPAINITRNTDELGSSLGCTADLIYNQTQALRRQLEEPLRQLAQNLMNYMLQLKTVIVQIENSLQPLTSAITTLSNTIQNAINEVTTLVEKCKSGLNSAKTSCTNGVNSAKKTCEDTLSSINPLDAAWDAVDGAKDWFQKNGILRRKKRESPEYNQSITRYRHKRGICDVLNVGTSVCNIATSINVVCNPFEYLENKLKDAADLMLSALNSAKNFFAFEINSDLGLSGNINYTKNASTVYSEIKADILSRLQGFIDFITSVSNILALTLLILFIKSLLHLKKYRTKDYYDNIYITLAFVDFDNNCKEKNQDFVLPLQPREQNKYIDTRSFMLSRVETKTMKYELKMIMYHMIGSTLFIAFDYLLYYALNLVTEYGKVAITVDGVNSVDIDIEGTGIFATILRVLVRDLNLNNTFSVDLNFTTCLPNPSQPDVSNIPVLIILYIVALSFVLLQGYGMRLRRKIAAWFYPEQELCRILYLHEKIIHGRLTIGAWLKDHIFTRRKENEVREKISLRAYIAYKSPFMTKVLDICLPPRRSCLSCDRAARRGMVFKKCVNKTCNALYCEECFIVMKMYCLVCDTRNEASRLS